MSETEIKNLSKAGANIAVGDYGKTLRNMVTLKHEEVEIPFVKQPYKSENEKASYFLALILILSALIVYFSLDFYL